VAGIVLYNAVVTAAFVDPFHRYHYMTMPVEIVCAGFGLRVAADLLRSNLATRTSMRSNPSALASISAAVPSRPASPKSPAAGERG